MSIKISKVYPPNPDCGDSTGKLGISTIKGSVVVSGITANVENYDVDYHARLSLFDSKQGWGSRLKKMGIVSCEVFEFYFRTNLNNYIVSYEKELLGRTLSVTEVDLEKLTKDFAPKLYEYHLKRLERKLLERPVEAIPFEDGEFLSTYRHDTDYNNWHGDYEFNNEYGCLVTTSKIELPTNGLAKMLNLCNLMYEFEDISTEVDFKHLVPEQQLIVLKKLLSRASDLETQNDMYLPYVLRLSGNDDYSMSKSFATLEDMEYELVFLRIMQPLDMTMDVYGRGYYFTN